MDIRKWYNKYSIDIQLVYNSEATKNNYKSQVLSFLNYFKNEEDYFRRQKTKTVEEELLEQIKFCLYCNNEAQAIRMLEQYKYYIQNKYENNY